MRDINCADDICNTCLKFRPANCQLFIVNDPTEPTIKQDSALLLLLFAVEKPVGKVPKNVEMEHSAGITSVCRMLWADGLTLPPSADL